MNILILGGGGREHALTWKLAQSPAVAQLYALPGNPGIAQFAKLVDIKIGELDKIADFAERNNIHLTVVGPEAPLAAGIADIFLARGLKIFGPVKQAAEIESSKAFAKGLMRKYNIPTAAYEVFEDIGAASRYIEQKGAPIVIKADGLAAGKGVVVAMNIEEAHAALRRVMQSAEFGRAGAKVVIEEYLEGEEVSVLAFTDGETVIPMLPAQDHKRVFDADRGPNTGGMGAYAPAPAADNAIREFALHNILYPVVAALKKEGRTYQGCLYAGLIITGSGVKVIEFNARFGDPETQAILPLLDSDLAEILLACAEGRLSAMDIKWKQGAAVCVVLASGGYPGEYNTGFPIDGLAGAQDQNTVVFHAGTKNAGGRIVSAGGRVLGITALGGDIKDARQKAYQTAAAVTFEQSHYRRDIAWRAV